MVSIKIIVVAFFVLNLMTLLLLYMDFSMKNRADDKEQVFLEQAASKTHYSTRINEDLENNETIESKGPYAFDDPKIAYALLEKLDIFEEIKPGSLKGVKDSNPAGGLLANNNYCKEHRAYFVSHPEIVFDNLNIVTNYWRSHKVRTQVIPKIGKDMHPEIYPGAKNPRSSMKIDANMFFTYELFFYKRHVGRQFSCLSQSSNHVPGHDKMGRKDLVGQAQVDYAKKFESRPHCFNFNKYFPKTWVLQKKDQCLEFFKEFNSEKYQTMKKERNVVYFRKIGAGVHEGKGVFPVNNKEEAYLNKLYKKGAACGKIKYNNLIQYNVHNLLLVQNRKFGMRMFLLIASANPLIAYYHDGYARLSMNEYDPNSQKIETFVTNIGVNIEQKTKDGQLTSAQVHEMTSWSLEDLQDYLFETGIINDKTWLNDYLRVEMKKVMIHLLRMSQSGFFKKSSVFELFGLDFVMDENLDLWFIEANAMPLINGFTKRSTVLMNTMLKDTFEIVLGLQRSRMKRVIDYINSLTREGETGTNITDLEEKRKVFKKITRNYFEPEFVPSPNNTFQLIIDDNLSGTDRYADLIEQECL